jgi:hypothetical protein
MVLNFITLYQNVLRRKLLAIQGSDFLPFSCRMYLQRYFSDSCVNIDQNGQTVVLMLMQLLLLKLVLVACQCLELEILGVKLSSPWLTQLSMKRQVLQCWITWFQFSLVWLPSSDKNRCNLLSFNAMA